MTDGSKLWVKVVRLCKERGSVTLDLYDRRKGAQRFARAVSDAVRLGLIERKGAHEGRVVYQLTSEENWPSYVPIELSRPVPSARG